MAHIRAVLLDLDDTLCDSEGLSPIRLQAVESALTGAVDATLLGEVIREALSWDSVGVPGRFTNRLARMTERLGLDDETSNRMRTVYNSVLMDNLTLYDGVRDTLAWLRDRFTLGLITNGPTDLQRNKIAVLQLDDVFDCIAIGGEVGAHKPDRRIFEYCLTGLNVDAAQCIYIGDRTEADVVGARNMGIIAIRIRKSYPFHMDEEPEPDYFLDSVNDLPALMVREGWAS